MTGEGKRVIDGVGDALTLLPEASFFVCGRFSRRSSVNDKGEMEVMGQTSDSEGFQTSSD